MKKVLNYLEKATTVMFALTALLSLGLAVSHWDDAAARWVFTLALIVSVLGIFGTVTWRAEQ